LINQRQVDARTCVAVMVCVEFDFFFSHVRKVSAEVLIRPTSFPIGWMAAKSGVAERVCELTEQPAGISGEPGPRLPKHPATLERRHSNQQYAVTRNLPSAAGEGTLTETWRAFSLF